MLVISFLIFFYKFKILYIISYNFFYRNMFDHSGFPGQVDSRSLGTNEDHHLENRRRQVNGPFVNGQLVKSSLSGTKSVLSGNIKTTKKLHE